MYHRIADTSLYYGLVEACCRLSELTGEKYDDIYDECICADGEEFSRISLPIGVYEDKSIPIEFLENWLKNKLPKQGLSDLNRYMVNDMVGKMVDDWYNHKIEEYYKKKGSKNERTDSN